MAQTLSRIGKYELRAVVARTASSIVYDGWDSDINRRVAVKAVPLSALGDNRETLVRFQRGVRAAGQLSHPNIVNIYDYGETTSDAYIVMEFVDGPALQQMLDRGHHFDLKSITRIVSEVLSALQYSYGRGVVHRDIKPANIMLTPERSAKITDFGIARLGDADITQAGMLIGTPAYMAPEQFTGERIDGRTDVYSTGVMLYHLLTGSLPFEGSLATIMHKVLNVPAPKASARSAVATPVLDHIVSRAMAKRPEDRFQSAAEFRAALQGALAFEDVTLRRTPASRLDAGRRAKTTGSRSMLVPAAMAAGVFLAGAATFGLVWHLGRTIVPPRPPVLAEAAQVAPPAVLPPPVPAPVATPLPPAPQPAPAPEPAAAIPAPDPAPVAKDQASTGLAEPAPALVLPAPANIAASVAPPPPPAETIQAPPAFVP
ncbi:MAG: serine/threonine protein kinase [Proteobacteria bacterium]|nr:serine/threonine protein kinase [Pseudomonadota bacterium]